MPRLQGVRLRSLLFVPGDRPERFAKAATSGADAVILDLEDSVVAAAKAAAREHVAAFLAEATPGPPVFVRINPLDAGMVDADLAAIPAGAGFGVVLPKAEGAASLAALDARLAGTALRILPIVTETPRALFAMDYSGVSDRLIGLTWGAEDLSAAVGATTAREADGRYRPPYELARSLTLFAAHAAGVAAIETVFPDLADAAALRAYATRGRQDGFTGMLALHPSQIAPIHAGFAPTDAEIADARAIVAHFGAGGGAGALRLDGRMIDAPHRAAAERLLAGLDPA